MTISIDPELKRACPQLALGCVKGTVVVRESSADLVDELKARAGELSSQAAVIDSPQLAAVRQCYKSLGKDPSRYRGSSEALIRRVLSGKELYFINNVVEVNNLVSLESLCPVGSYDLGNVAEPIVFRIGRPGESYKGIGKGLINIAELPVFCDSNRPFGSPTSDSERAMITEQTTRVLAAIFCLAGSASLATWAQRAVSLLTRYADGSNLSFEIVQ